MALRMVPLVADPLHQDEALYGFWGRLISAGRDPWLATVPVDKPPLTFYLIAGSQAAFGVSEFATRLPGLAASLISIPLTWVLAQRLYGDRVTGLVAAAVMALTPYPVLFGATAFTDPILVAWWLAACYAAVRGRWGWAGLALGLAFATKQQAVVLGLLVIGLGVGQGRVTGTSNDARGWTLGRWRVASAKFIMGLALVVAVVSGWDAIRVARGAAAGFWGQGVDSYGGIRLIWPAESALRWRGWSRLAGYLLGWPWLVGLLLVGVGTLLWLDVTRRRQTQPALADLTLVTFGSFYLFFHMLVAFPVWDRYLLPMVPVMSLLLGRVVSSWWPVASGQWSVVSGEWCGTFHVLRFALSAILVLLLAGGGLMAAAGRIPVGGDHGAYDGLEEVMVYLRALPVGTVLYDRWLSWHYDLYLFDAHLYRAGFPSLEWLATDVAALFDGRPRYLVLPSWESAARLERTLAQVRLAMSPVLTTRRRDGTTSFVVYEIVR
jgi:4-amino-4-deoxy-L-arabinose transferase-like glycosyltransferase